MDGCMDGCVDGCVDGCMDGFMDECIFSHAFYDLWITALKVTFQFFN